ncbi:type II secretion system protein M [Thalassotalea sp. 1_MG-2023]|uniref:type II secretion system protein M n=1 Tax=Thalassotalea sp. 1_MG-2023 TaxID=3062680 RepID=UPI0026E2DBF5|nr:type II secretion system protein M [Thalassotalea sp. 1_MG-2023]MDO6425711.1 type II secretion system protein M [Thalassotalea sp. 1_MG-2023]
MKEWWVNLQLREQRLVAALGSVLCIFVFYQLVWQPLTNGVSKAEQKLERQQALLSWVEEETARIAQFQKAQPNSSQNTSLASIVNRTAQQQQIVIARLQPQSGGVLVWVDNINFNDLLTWLSRLSKEHGVKVINIDISQDNVSGSVAVKRLQLGR